MTNPGTDLAAKIAPALEAALLARREAIIAASGGIFIRGAVRLIFPAILDETPNLAAVALDTISREFGSMTVNDFLAIFAARLEVLRETRQI